MANAAAKFALFVSCVEGCPVTRFGTRTMIGATRSARTPDVVTYDPTVVVAIPLDEHRKYRREYERALANGTLKARGAEEWSAQNRQEPPQKRGEGTPSTPTVATPKAQE